MAEELVIGDFLLDLTPTVSDGAWFVREARDMVEGTVSTYKVSSEKYKLYAEIDEVQLINGSKWVVAGESFTGPKWVFGQLRYRV